MNDADFPLNIAIQRAYRGWWLVALLTIVGGLGGLLVSTLRVPVYEASAEFTFSIDFSRTGILTDVEEDQAFEALSDVIFASDVLQAAAADASQQGIPITLVDLQSSIAKERSFNTWTFRVRQADPRAAAAITNLWANHALRALDSAAQAALEVGALSARLEGLQRCLSASVLTEPTMAGCTGADRAAIQAELARSGEQIVAARQASRGMLPGMGYQWTRAAVENPRAVANGRGRLALAGALLGLLAGLLAVESGLTARRHA